MFIFTQSYTIASVRLLDKSFSKVSKDGGKYSLKCMERCLLWPKSQDFQIGDACRWHTTYQIIRDIIQTYKKAQQWHVDDEAYFHFKPDDFGTLVLMLRVTLGYDNKI